MKNLLNPEGIDRSDLEQRVLNYYEYAESHKGNSNSIFITAVITKADLLELLNSTDDTEGIRLYLSKDSDDMDTQDDIRLLAVPVKSENNNYFGDLTPAEGKIHLTVCRDPYCPNSFSPTTPNLLSDGTINLLN